MKIIDFINSFVEIRQNDFENFQKRGARPVWFCGRYFITKTEFLQKY